MAEFLTTASLSPFTSLPDAQLQVIIADLEAFAVDAAACLGDPSTLTDAQRAAVVAVLRSAALRWAERAEGGDRQLTSGPFTYGPAPGHQSSEGRKPLLWPSEITSLQRICLGASRRKARMGWLA